MEKRVFTHYEPHFLNDFTAVLLYSSPCANRGKCKFCTYWKDSTKVKDIITQCKFNTEILNQVDWKNQYGILSICPSASFSELPYFTVKELKEKLWDSSFRTFISECYWEYGDMMNHLYQEFNIPGMQTIFKVGMETFNNEFRKYLGKNYGYVPPSEVRKKFNGVTLLVGVEGQTRSMISEDIYIAKEECFECVDINIFDDRAPGLKVKADKELIEWFKNEVEIPDNCKVWSDPNEYLGLEPEA